MEHMAKLKTEKSPAEKFNEWKQDYLSCSVLPSAHRDFIEKWSAVFDKVPNDSYLKSAMYGVLEENLSGAWGVSMGLENLRRILPVAERLIAKDCFDDALTLFSFFWEYNADTIEQGIKNKQMHQTEAARKEHKAWNKMKPEMKALWNYLYQVECKLHPVPPKEEKSPTSSATNEKEEKRPIRSATNEYDAVTRVFRDYKEAIMTLLPDYPAEADAKKEFAKAFRVFTAVCLECRGKTATDYVPEKRAPRSEESKEKMRRSYAKKKQKEKTLSPEV